MKGGQGISHQGSLGDLTLRWFWSFWRGQSKLTNLPRPSNISSPFFDPSPIHFQARIGRKILARARLREFLGSFWDLFGYLQGLPGRPLKRPFLRFFLRFRALKKGLVTLVNKWWPSSQGFRADTEEGFDFKGGSCHDRNRHNRQTRHACLLVLYVDTRCQRGHPTPAEHHGEKRKNKVFLFVCKFLAVRNVLKSAGQIFSSGQRGAKNFSDTFWIVFGS